MTINLENRKKTDFSLIVNAAEKKPRTFTELLHITKLSRKTLSLRLKELRSSDTLLKREGVYMLNGASSLMNENINSAERFSKVFFKRKIGTGLMLVMLLICFSASGYVLAKFLMNQEPVIIGNFTATVDVIDVKNAYAWQVLIMYNSSELAVSKATPGGFIGAQYLALNTTDISKGLFVKNTDIEDGVLLVGGSLIGNVSGKNGDGSLAIIDFGYFVEDYAKPRIVLKEKIMETYLLDPWGSLIPIENSTLTLNIIENE